MISATSSTCAERAGAASAGERRQLSVMFCDLMGFTELAYRLDPEDLSDLIREYQDLVTTMVERFRGFIARFFGDGVLVYFGWPTAHEANAEQAVRAGLAITDAIGQVRNQTQQLR